MDHLAPSIPSEEDSRTGGRCSSSSATIPMKTFMSFNRCVPLGASGSGHRSAQAMPFSIEALRCLVAYAGDRVSSIGHASSVCAMCNTSKRRWRLATKRQPIQSPVKDLARALLAPPGCSPCRTSRHRQKEFENGSVPCPVRSFPSSCIILTQG